MSFELTSNSCSRISRASQNCNTKNSCSVHKSEKYTTKLLKEKKRKNRRNKIPHLEEAKLFKKLKGVKFQSQATNLNEVTMKNGEKRIDPTYSKWVFWNSCAHTLMKRIIMLLKYLLIRLTIKEEVGSNFKIPKDFLPVWNQKRFLKLKKVYEQLF